LQSAVKPREEPSRLLCRRCSCPNLERGAPLPLPSSPTLTSRVPSENHQTALQISTLRPTRGTVWECRRRFGRALTPSEDPQSLALYRHPFPNSRTLAHFLIKTANPTRRPSQPYKTPFAPDPMTRRRVGSRWPTLIEMAKLAPKASNDFEKPFALVRAPPYLYDFALSHWSAATVPPPNPPNPGARRRSASPAPIPDLADLPRIVRRPASSESTSCPIAAREYRRTLELQPASAALTCDWQRTCRAGRCLSGFRTLREAAKSSDRCHLTTRASAASAVGARYMPLPGSPVVAIALLPFSPGNDTTIPILFIDISAPIGASPFPHIRGKEKKDYSRKHRHRRRIFHDYHRRWRRTTIFIANGTVFTPVAAPPLALRSGNECKRTLSPSSGTGRPGTRTGWAQARLLGEISIITEIARPLCHLLTARTAL